MDKRAQAALEYISTYGLAVLFIAIAIVGLYSLGAFNMGRHGAPCSASVGFACSNPVLYGSGDLSASIGDIDEPITITNVSCSSSSSSPGAWVPININVAAGQALAIPNFVCPIGSSKIGTQFSGYLWIRYNVQNGAQGVISQIGSVSLQVSSYAGSAVPPTLGATNFSGTIYYLPINITNNQNESTCVNLSKASTFQQLVTINPSEYSSYERPDLGNIRFYQNTNELYSWCESGCNSSAQSAVFWVKMPSCLAAHESSAIQLAFETPLMDYDSNYAGEAPQLSPSYAEFDNGKNVFNFYDGFGSITDGNWGKYGSGTATISDKLTLTTGNGTDEGIVTAQAYSSPQILESLLIDPLGMGVNTTGKVNGTNENPIFAYISADETAAGQIELIAQWTGGAAPYNYSVVFYSGSYPSCILDKTVVARTYANPNPVTALMSQGIIINATTTPKYYCAGVEDMADDSSISATIFAVGDSISSAPYSVDAKNAKPYASRSLSLSGLASDETVVPNNYPDVVLQYANGDISTFYAPLNTDADRGNALLSALSSMQNGSQIYLKAENYDVGYSTIDLSNGGTLSGTQIHGAGKFLTTIYSSTTGYGATSLVIPANNSVVSDLTLINYGTDKYAWGSYRGTDNADAFSNATLRNVQLVASSGIMLEETGPSTANAYNITVISTGMTYSDQGAIHMETTGSLLNVFDSNVVAVALNNKGTDGATGEIAYLGTIHSVNTRVSSTGGVSGWTWGVATVAGGSILVYGGNVTAPFSFVQEGSRLGANSTVHIVGGESGTIANLGSAGYGPYSYQKSPLTPPNLQSGGSLTASIAAPGGTVINYGDELQLSAVASGGVPPYTYQWYNSTLGPSGCLASPLYLDNSTYFGYPQQNMTYCITVNDSEGSSAFNYTQIKVEPLPPMAYLSITITNHQSAGVAGPFQQMLAFNASQYQGYEAEDLGNIRFFYGSNELYSWCESNCTSWDPDTIFWINLPNGIGATNTIIINMTFENLPFEYDSVYAGEAPNQSYYIRGVYAEFDNGAKVFPLSYTNFNGTACPSPTVWDCLGNFSISNSGVLGNGILNPAEDLGREWASNYTFDIYADITNVTNPSKGVTEGIYITPTLGGSPNGNVLGFSTCTSAYACSGSLIAPLNQWNIYTVHPELWVWPTVEPVIVDSQLNYGPWLHAAVSTPNYKRMPNILQETVNDNGGANISIQWARLRTYPPNGVMPTVLFGSVTVPQEEEATAIKTSLVTSATTHSSSSTKPAINSASSAQSTSEQAFVPTLGESTSITPTSQDAWFYDGYDIEYNNPAIVMEGVLGVSQHIAITSNSVGALGGGNILGMAWLSQGSEQGYLNDEPLMFSKDSEVNADAATYHLYIGLDGSDVSYDWQWVRTRTPPPDGIMPNVTISGLTS